MDGKIRLAQGGGGEATARLIREIFRPYLSHPELVKGNDAAVLDIAGGRMAVTTDSFVITPWRFPGGDIGKLAVCGTVNDLAVSGAEPLGLTAAFIIEEGFNAGDLESIVRSMADAALEAGVHIVAGDTKVVNKGAADGIFINTTGVGLMPEGVYLGGETARSGDRVILTGSVGDHGAAVLLARGELGIRGRLASDCAPLNTLLLPLVKEYKNKIRVMRDPTRGGLGTTLNEIARQSKVSIRINETEIPIKQEVRGICELLGLDPLYLANEGKAVLVVEPESAAEILTRLREHELGKEAGIIGEVQEENPGLVSMINRLGGERILPLGGGEHLPRIC